MNTPVLRPAVRGLVIDAEQRVLLVRLCYPAGTWWVLPGGGIAPGEDDHEALRRELIEELGLADADIGPLVWKRTHLFSLLDSDGVSWDGQSESVYLVKSDYFEPQPLMSPEELKAEHIDEIRWWSRSEIDTYSGPDNFAPPELSMCLGQLLDSAAPDIPFFLHQQD